MPLAPAIVLGTAVTTLLGGGVIHPMGRLMRVAMSALQ